MRCYDLLKNPARHFIKPRFNMNLHRRRGDLGHHLFDDHHFRLGGFHPKQASVFAIKNGLASSGVQMNASLFKIASGQGWNGWGHIGVLATCPYCSHRLGIG